MLHGNLKRSIANQNGFNQLLPDTFFSVQTKEVMDNPKNVHFINVFHDICPVVLFLLTVWLPFDLFMSSQCVRSRRHVCMTSEAQERDLINRIEQNIVALCGGHLCLDSVLIDSLMQISRSKLVFITGSFAKSSS